VIRFSGPETARLTETAFRRAGYLMLMPFALAVAIRSIDRVFRARRHSGGGYLVPVTIDLRSPEQVASDLFFNHLSFLLFRAEPEAVGDLPGLVGSLKEQLYDQVKARMPRHLQEASHLFRILPARIAGRMVGIYLGGEVGTFSFTHLGQTAYPHGRFMDAAVLDLTHMPRVPVPPGIGIFLQPFRERLNVIFSYLAGMITEEEADAVAVSIREGLLGEGGDGIR